MGRKRIENNNLKTRISIRLKNEHIDEIKKEGSLQEIIESLVIKYIESRKKSKNNDEI